MENIELWAKNKKKFEDRKHKMGVPIGKYDHITWWINGSVEDSAQKMDIKLFNQYEEEKINSEDVITGFMYNNKVKPKDRSWSDKEFLEWLGSLGYRRAAYESVKV